MISCLITTTEFLLMVGFQSTISETAHSAMVFMEDIISRLRITIVHVSIKITTIVDRMVANSLINKAVLHFDHSMFNIRFTCSLTLLAMLSNSHNTSSRTSQQTKP